MLHELFFLNPHQTFCDTKCIVDRPNIVCHLWLRLLLGPTASDLSVTARVDYINGAGQLGRSATHWAALHGNVELLYALLNAADGRLDLDARDAAGTLTIRQILFVFAEDRIFFSLAEC